MFLENPLAILVAVREREGEYVWAAQVGAARRAGVREEAIDLIRTKGDPAKLSDEERDIVTYSQQLVQKNRIDQAAFDRLKQRHDVQWLVELTAAANYYGFLSGVVNAFEVPAPPDTRDRPEQVRIIGFAADRVDGFGIDDQERRPVEIVEESELETLRCSVTDADCLKRAKSMGKKVEIVD